MTHGHGHAACEDFNITFVTPVRPENEEVMIHQGAQKSAFKIVTVDRAQKRHTPNRNA